MQSRRGHHTFSHASSSSPSSPLSVIFSAAENFLRGQSCPPDRDAHLLFISKLHGATCGTDDPRRGRRRHHRLHHGDFQRYPSSTTTQVREYHPSYQGFWDDRRTTGWRIVRAARFLEMGLHHVPWVWSSFHWSSIIPLSWRDGFSCKNICSRVRIVTLADSS